MSACCCCEVTSVVSDSARPHRRQPARLLCPWDSPGKNTGVVAISFCNAWKWKVEVKSLSCVRLSPTPWTAAYQVPPSMGFSRQEYWSGVPLPAPISDHKSLPSFIHKVCSHRKEFTETLEWPERLVFNYSQFTSIISENFCHIHFILYLSLVFFFFPLSLSSLIASGWKVNDHFLMVLRWALDTIYGKTMQN